jgi:methylated-DNA-protein-cysteine methyltransferase-like protein
MAQTQSAFHATGHEGVGRAAGTGRPTFFAHVFALVSRIPRGRVTTYGAIARALGTPRAARSVGWALSLAPDEDALPCHRVVDRNGFLSGGWHWGHPDVMAGLLRDEGVPFLDSYRVDLAACLWSPDGDDLDRPGSSIAIADRD